LGPGPPGDCEANFLDEQEAYDVSHEGLLGVRKRVFPEASQVCLAAIALQDVGFGLGTTERQVILRRQAQCSIRMPLIMVGRMMRRCVVDGSLPPNWP
jgi:hypothetical protein